MATTTTTAATTTAAPQATRTRTDVAPFPAPAPIPASTPTHAAPTLAPERLQWRLTRAALRLGARLSAGIACGYRHGFDSGPMLDYVYRNEATGAPLIGRLVDRVYLNQIGWRAIRARRTLLDATLADLIAARRTAALPTHIVDIAAGPGRYVLELVARLSENNGGNDLSVTCRDLDAEGLRQGAILAASLGLTRARFTQGDATDPVALAHIAPAPGIVIASGVYEIITEDALIRRSMAGVRGVLPADGAFVFTTQIAHPQLVMIANTLPNRNGEPWVMGTRAVETVETWARAAGFHTVHTAVEPHGLFAVTVAR